MSPANIKCWGYCQILNIGLPPSYCEGLSLLNVEHLSLSLMGLVGDWHVTH